MNEDYRFRCWSYHHELIWGGDFTFEDYGIDDSEGIVSNFSCSFCNAYVEFYLPIGEVKQ
jgi:hypothetical protein